MIRKILLFIFLIFTIIWFAIAYTMKNSVVHLIKNSESDNIKISYNNVKISGYPFNWKISLIEPKVKLIDHVNSKEFSSMSITLTIDSSTKKATVDLGEFIKENEDYGNKSFEYIVRGNEAIQATAKLNKALYKVEKDDNLKSIIKSVKLNNKQLSISKDNERIFNIKNLAFFMHNKNFLEYEDISLLLAMDYDSEIDLVNFKNASLDLATSLKFVKEDSNSNILKGLALERFILICDNSSKIDIKGGLEFSSGKLPEGKLSFELGNYHAIIDKLLPTNIIFSKKIIKAIIAKAINKPSEESLQANAEGPINLQNPTYNSIEKAKFDIDFSDNGINIGSINLLEFKLGEEEVNTSPPVATPAAEH